MRALKWTNVDFTARHVEAVCRKTLASPKRGRLGRAPMTDAVTDGLGSHTPRHSFCSHLAMHGVSARAIQELAGHSSLATTERYMHSLNAMIRPNEHFRFQFVEPG